LNQFAGNFFKLNNSYEQRLKFLFNFFYTILCQNKSNKIVDYALKYTNKTVGVSEYKILDKLSEDILNKPPTEEDINLQNKKLVV
jgi:hypothetical protein